MDDARHTEDDRQPDATRTATRAFKSVLEPSMPAASLFRWRGAVDIFGVTRIVNFAHGAFYMLALRAFTLTEQFSGAIGFGAASWWRR